MMGRCCSSPLVIVGFVLFAISFKPIILPRLMELHRSPLDTTIGTIEILSPKELREAYQGKRVVVVGGTRGVGLGFALAVAKAGADVTVVGRSEKSGARALEQLRQVDPSGTISFVQGDVGSVAKATALVDSLEEQVKSQKEPKGYDYLVVTAAVFPDWERPHQQEDGIDRCFAIAVVGRYILYSNMGRFMKPKDARVLNVCASGEIPSTSMDRSLASGERDPSNLFESMMTFANGNEIMLKVIDADPDLHLNTTRVSTHPGMLKTDLHRGQGLLFDVAEAVTVALAGVSVEECGVRQASILASPKLKHGQLSYVSSDMKGRLASSEINATAETELPWLKDFLGQVLAE